MTRPGPVFYLLLGVSSEYAQLITGQVAVRTVPVIGQAQPELSPSKRQKTGPGFVQTDNSHAQVQSFAWVHETRHTSFENVFEIKGMAREHWPCYYFNMS